MLLWGIFLHHSRMSLSGSGSSHEADGSCGAWDLGCMKAQLDLFLDGKEFQSEQSIGLKKTTKKPSDDSLVCYVKDSPMTESVAGLDLMAPLSLLALQ